MAFTLSGIQVAIRGALRSVYEWPVVMLGLDSSGNPVPVVVSSSGGSVVEPGAGQSQGNATAVPADNANGTEIGTRPSATSGVRFYMSATSSVTLFIAPHGSVPGSPPSVTWTVANTSATDGAIHDEPLAGTDGLFLTASTGTVEARYVQR